MQRRIRVGKYEISAVTGPYTYSGPDSVEIAIFSEGDRWVLPDQLPGMPLAERFQVAGDTAVAGYVTMEEVAQLISFLEKL